MANAISPPKRPERLNAGCRVSIRAPETLSLLPEFIKVAEALLLGAVGEAIGEATRERYATEISSAKYLATTLSSHSKLSLCK